MIKFNHVSVKHTNSDRQVLSDISFQAHVNDVVCIIGKSGVGKTTLLHTILKQTKIITGEVEFLGHNINNVSRKKWKELIGSIGYLSQESNAFSEDTVFLTIKRDLLNYKQWWQRILFYLNYQERLQIFQILEELQILDYAFTKIQNLSQGQKQRVEIAKLLLKKPRLILADEPTAALDQATAELTINLIKQLSRTYNCCILINIHDLQLLKKISKKTLAIKQGKLVFYKNTNQVGALDLKQVYC